MLPASSSSRQYLPLMATAAKGLLVLLLSGWLLLALGWALLHGWIVPRIGEFRPQLEALATRATGLKVQIGDLDAHSTGVFPSVELKQVRLLDAQGRPALVLPQVWISVSPQSLLTLGLEQLVLRGAELDVRRTPDGRLWLAGIPISPENKRGEQPLADWLLTQREWALLGGTLRWHDEVEGLSLVLTDVDAVLRNPGQRHKLRIDATPPQEWGERFSLRGDFKQPLLARSPSDWRQWSGQLYGQFSRIDLAPLAAYARLAGVGLEQGRGALRAWIDVAPGRIAGATADLTLNDARVRLAAQLEPLALRSLAGRLSWHDAGGQGLDLQTQSLGFETEDGLRWPGGNLSLSAGLDAQGRITRGKLQADKLDLAAVSRILQRLPLDAAWRAQLATRAPQGLIEHVEGNWQGAPEAPTQAQLRGRVSALALAAGGPAEPGLAGVALDFQFQREAGKDKAEARFALQDGWLEFPGHFTEPRLPLDKLSGELRLVRQARGTELELRQVQFQGRDGQGRLQGSWKQAAGGPALGHLDLSGELERADAARVWRYLPQQLPETREYLRQSITQGELQDVRFKVKGPVAGFPYRKPGDGDFQVSARLRNAGYAYAPPSLGDPAAKPWPALVQLDAELLLQRASLSIKRAQARVAGHPGLAVSRTEARIADLLQQPVVEVSGDLKGPLAQALALVNQSPLAGLTRQALSRTTATGAAEVQLKMQLPLQQLAQSKVQGSVALQGNDLQFAPEAPPLSRARGSVGFSETGFALNNVQARLLGGDARLEGGMRAGRRPDEPEVQLRVQGVASSEGLRQWRELSALAPLWRQASGSATYGATLGFRQGLLELTVASNLSGMALALPEPLGKAAAGALPLRIEKTLLRESLAPGRRPRDRLAVTVGPGPGLAQPLALAYVRDIGDSTTRVLGGQISLGVDRPAEPSDREVRAQVQVPRLDLDAWAPLWRSAQGEEPAAVGSSGAYLPTVLNLRTGQLSVQGHTLQQLSLQGRREGELWRAQLSANELSGEVQYRAPADGQGGRLFARLSRLSLGASGGQEVEALLDTQPASIPALDIVVDELELRGKKLGRLEVEAVNRPLAGRDAPREWRLNKLRLSVPEATLNATGGWTPLPAAAPLRGAAVRRSTQLDFRLDVADSGELLKRLGLEGAIRRGRGRLEGQIGWQGSPLALHLPSLDGRMQVDIESGQFLRAEPGAAKLLGVLSLQALPRRLALDFRDVFSEGFAFDWIRGDVAVREGVASTGDLRMKGVNAAVLMEGSADIARETQDLRVVVVPEINAGTASLLAAAVNPAMALSTFVAQWLLRQPLNQASTQEFLVTGTWGDPQIQRVARNRAEGRKEAQP